MFKKQKTLISKFLTEHKSVIQTGVSVAKSIHNFALTKSPLSFIEGGMQIILGLSEVENHYSYNFFNTANGWFKLVSSFEEQPLYDMFYEILKQYPFKQLTFKYEAANVGIHTHPLCEIGYDKYGFWIKDLSLKNELLSFFLQEKMKEINSNFLSIITIPANKGSDIASKNIKYDLQAEVFRDISSSLSEEWVPYLQSFIDKKISRSVIFTGQPGSGKTTASQTILKHLNLKTLKFKYDDKLTNLNTMKFLISALNIEAVLLDDFDQVRNTTSLLEFLEWTHDNTRVVIAISNSLKEFHPAILRPGRFDEITTVNHLDEGLVKSILIEEYHDLIPKIKTWPVAFINELNSRLKNNPKMDIDNSIEELENRVTKQLQILK